MTLLARKCIDKEKFTEGLGSLRLDAESSTAHPRLEFCLQLQIILVLPQIAT